MKVSELIKPTDIKQWKQGDTIAIKAGTGAGKSYFIKNVLYDYAKENNKKILMLLHRKNPVDQFKHELIEEGKINHIEVKTYQSIEHYFLKKNKYTFTGYDYIVCDEFHYFMSDANFNKYTDISLNSILDQDNKVKIFMSATGEYMTQYMKEIKKIKPVIYEMPFNYDFIHGLNFFYKDKVLDQLVQNFINKGEKAIVFVQSLKQAYELHKKYKDYTLFNCSKDNKKYYKHVDENKINEMLVNEMFNEQILITTTVMDTGVNIIDDKLTNVVVSGIFDLGVIIQCIGRKRLVSKGDYINLYIQGYSNKRLGGQKTQIIKRKTKAEYVMKYGTEEYVKKYPRDTNDIIIYDQLVEGEDKVKKEVNEMIFFKNRVDIVEINKMLELGQFGFSKYIAKKLGFYDGKEKFYEYKVIDLENKNRELEDYLESIVGEVMLTAEDRNELIENINVRDGNNNRLLKNINTLNAKLEENGLDYVISNFETSRMVNGKKKNYKTAWKVRKIVD